MLNSIDKRIGRTFILAALSIALQNCQDPGSGPVTGSTPRAGTAYSALVSGDQISWNDLGKPLASNQGIGIAVGADGSVFKVDQPVSPNTDAGTVSRYTPHEAANKWDSYGGLAQRLAVDPKGHPWTVHYTQGLRYYSGLNGSGQHVWTQIPGAPARLVDVAINSQGTLVVLSKATDTSSNARVFYWTTSTNNPQPYSSWVELPGQKGIRLGADSLNSFRLVNSTGGIFVWDHPNSEWDAVTGPPLNEIAVGKSGRTWATVNSPPGGDTIAYKDPAGSFFAANGSANHMAAHISSEPWLIHPDGYPRRGGSSRVWETSFEGIGDFYNLYWTQDTAVYKANQILDSITVRHGGRSHKAWITAARASNNNNNLVHRAYPLLSFTRTPANVFNGPCLVSMWVYLDINLAVRGTVNDTLIDDWFSFATFTSETNDTWAPVATVNLGVDGRVYSYHTPHTDEGVMTFYYNDASDPSGTKKFPQREWVRLDMLVYLHPTQGYLKVWQNKTHIVSADIRYGNGTLAQAHFGMYASAAVASGTVYNDKLRIQPVADAAEAEKYVNWPW